MATPTCIIRQSDLKRKKNKRCALAAANLMFEPKYIARMLRRTLLQETKTFTLTENGFAEVQIACPKIYIYIKKNDYIWNMFSVKTAVQEQNG